METDPELKKPKYIGGVLYKDYIREYMRNRYNNDEEFRQKAKENRMKSYYKKKNEK